MSDLVDQKVGMFLGFGEIYRYKSPNACVAPHFFAYDAGRQVLIDRAGEVNLLEESDLNQKGINKVCQILSVSHTIVMNGLFVLGVCQIFFRRFCSEDTVNLDWKVVKAFYQIVPRLPQTPGY